MTKFEDLCERGRQRHGAKFNPDCLSKKFIPWYNNGLRICVKMHHGETLFGMVAATTGWVPTFMIMRREGQVGSSDLVDDSDEIISYAVEHFRKRKRCTYYPLNEGPLKGLHEKG